ncbi:MAG: outer membrane beta-barrel protein [Saprospiraceae bacterium]
MNKYQWGIVLTIILFSTKVHGQTSSVELNVLTVGLGFSNIKGHSILKDRYEKINTFSLGFSVQYNFPARMAIETGIFLDQRGGDFIAMEREIKQNPIRLGDTINRLYQNRFLYFNIPIVFKVNIYRKKTFSLYGNIGGYYAYLIKQLWKEERFDVFTTVEPQTRQFDYRTADFGWLIGLEAVIPCSKITSLKILVNYSRGTRNFIAKEELINAYHEKTSINIGFSFKLQRP